MEWVKDKRFIAVVVIAAVLLSASIGIISVKASRGGTNNSKNAYEYTSDNPDFLGNYYTIKANYDGKKFSSMTFTVMKKDSKGKFLLVNDNYTVQRCKKTVEQFLKVQNTDKLGDPTGDSNLTIQFINSVKQLKLKINSNTSK